MFERYPKLALELQWNPFSGRSPRALICKRDRFLKACALDVSQVVYVAGLALGEPIRLLMPWLKEHPDRDVVVLEEDYDALHHLLATDEGPALLSHPRVHLRWISSDEEGDLEQCAREFPRGRIVMVTLHKKDATFERRRLLLEKKTVLWHSVVSEAVTGHVLHRNIAANLRYLPGSFYVNTSQGALKGLPVIICGAGPSLACIAPKVRELASQAVILGCGSALSALSREGIRPHLGIAADPNPREQIALEGCCDRDIPLIYALRLYREVLPSFTGPRGYLHTPSATLLEQEIVSQLNLHHEAVGRDLGREALSVTTLAVSLARFWGCTPIILVGVDLALKGRRHYTLGVPPLEGELEPTVPHRSVRGRRVTTTVKWLMEQATLDHYAAQHPDVVWIDATGEGLGFNHIPYRSWDAIIPLLPPQPTLPGQIDALIQRHPVPVTQEHLHPVLQGLNGQFGLCLNLVSQLEKEDPSSGRSALWEHELTETCLYQQVLGPAMEALDRLYGHTTGFMRRRWGYLREMIQEYSSLV